ncbi:MAG: S1 RNA-binding domain-containing protein [Bacillota bacterium]
MSATTATNFPKWKIELASIILEKGPFPDGQVTSDIKAFAAEHGVTFPMARTAYYAYTKDIPDDLMKEVTEMNVKAQAVHMEDSNPQVPASTLKTSEDTAKTEDQTSDQHKTTPETYEKAPDVLELYPIGTIVEVEVTNVLRHGAVVATKDENKQEGFIFVGNITNGYVTDINKYFRFGDIVRAQVLKYDENKGQLTLSTKNLPLKEHGVAGLGDNWKPEPINTLSKAQQQLEALKGELIKQEAASTVETVTTVTKTDPPKTEESNIVPAALVDTVRKEELDDIRGFVKSVIGYDPSTAAVEAFLSLFTAHGVFKTSIAMAKVADTFEVDLGLLLAQRVGASLGNTPS